MSRAHVLMGIWTPRCCCWKASATILASPSWIYWANQTHFSVDCEPTKSTAGEREFGSRTTGWMDGREAPAPGRAGKWPNTTPKSQSSQPCQQQSQSHLQGVLGRGKSSLVAPWLQRASRLILAGWAWPRSPLPTSAALGQCWGLD